jgi:hypothetical protein
VAYKKELAQLGGERHMHAGTGDRLVAFDRRALETAWISGSDRENEFQ